MYPLLVVERFGSALIGRRQAVEGRGGHRRSFLFFPPPLASTTPVVPAAEKLTSQHAVCLSRARRLLAGGLG